MYLTPTEALQSTHISTIRDVRKHGGNIMPMKSCNKVYHAMVSLRHAENGGTQVMCRLHMHAAGIGKGACYTRYLT